MLALVVLASLFLILSPYYSSPPTSPPTPLQWIGAFALIAVTIIAVLLFFLRPPQRRPGEQVSY
jgi:hypothetical protein